MTRDNEFVCGKNKTNQISTIMKGIEEKYKDQNMDSIYQEQQQINKNSKDSQKP